MSKQTAQPSTRERLLDAAMDLFAQDGFGGASVSRIESQAGLAAGRGGLFRHFPSKEVLLREAVAREVGLCRTEMEAAHASFDPIGLSDRERARFYEQMFRDIHRFDRLFRLMLNEGDRVPELREAIWSALQPPGSKRIHGEDAVYTVAVAALGGYHLFSMMQGQSFNEVGLDRFIEALVDMTRPCPPADGGS